MHITFSVKASSFIDELIPQMDINYGVNCSGKEQLKSELEKLVSSISNDVLGKSPRFCRELKPSSLNDQIAGENSFDLFMSELSKMKSEKKNIINLTNENKKEVLEEHLFQAIKLVTQKNLWQFQNETNREKLLLSSECVNASLNKLSFVTSQLKSSKHSVPLDSYKKMCQTTALEEIIPYASADIIAETFLNLKMIFPENYKDFTALFCEKISNMDESLFLNLNERAIEQTTLTLASAEKFSDWYKELSKNISQEKAFKEKEAKLQAYNKKSSNLMGSGGFGKIDKEMHYKEHQKLLEKLYDQSIKEGKKAIYSGMFNSFEIKINSKGKYVLKKMNTEEVVKVDFEILESKGKYSDPFQLKSFDDYLMNFKNEEGQFNIVEKNDKKHLTMNDNFLEKALKVVNKAIVWESNANVAEKEKELTPERQEELKMLSEIYKNPKDKDDLFYPEEKNPITLDKNGIYHGYKNSQAKVMENYKKGLQKDFLVLSKKIEPLKKNGYEFIPYGAENTFLVKKPDGQSLVVYLGKDKMLRAFERSVMSEAILANYQGKNANFDSFLNLKDEQREVLKNYTGSLYAEMNSCLRENNCSDEMKKNVDLLEQTLVAINSQEAKKDYKILYRGVGSLPNAIQDKLNSNDQSLMLDAGFMSTTGELSVAKSFTGNNWTGDEKNEEGNKEDKKKDNKNDYEDEATQDNLAKSGSSLLMFKAKSCVGISVMSLYEGEDEFLCPPGMKFKVKKIGNENTYLLEEIEK